MERVSRLQARAAELLARRQGRAGRVNAYLLDGLLALAAAGVSVWTVFNDDHRWPWWVYLLAVATSVPLLWRRRYPGPMFLLGTVPNTVQAAVAHSTMPQVQLCAVLYVYTLADRGRDWQRWSMLAVLVVGNILGTRSPNGLLFSLLVCVGSFIFGSVVRELRRIARAEQERAQQLGAQAAAEERGRIAREMHDILAHAVSLMVIQAEAGPLLVHRDPEKAAKTFDTIADTGRDAMVQLRRVLGVLKEQGAGPQLAPQPTLAELPAVVERVRESGIAVELRLPGPGRALPADVEVAAYRIVQEALTNIVKHAGADRATVELTRTARRLELAVADNGRGRPGPMRRPAAWSGGRGLVGIRERAAACGGTVTAGPGPDGGFLVTAELPL